MINPGSGRRDGRADSQGCFELANGGSTQLTVVRASFLCPSLPRGSSMPVVSPYHQPRFRYISLIPPKIHACTPCRRSIGSIAGDRRHTGRWLAGCAEPATAAGPVRCLWNKVGTGALGRRTGLWAGRYVPIWTYRATMTQQPGAERSRATASRIWLQAQQPTILDAPLIPLISSSPWANRRANSPQSSSQISRNTPTVRVLRPASPDTHKTCPPVDKRELQQWCVTRLRPRSR